MKIQVVSYIDLIVLQAAMYDRKIMSRWLAAKSNPKIHPTPIQQVLHNTMGELFFEEQLFSIFNQMRLSRSDAKMTRRGHFTEDIRMRVISSLINEFRATLQDAERAWEFIKNRAPYTWRYSYLATIINETLRYEYESRKH